jgi:protein tyrosine phosphatase (PTP) superfamily phosphohydrolase (DUF442 family)
VPIPPPASSFPGELPPSRYLPTQPDFQPQLAPSSPEPTIRLQAPEPLGDREPYLPSQPRLYGPEPSPPKPPEPNTPTPSRKPDPLPDRPLIPPLPVGIPGFSEVRKNVSNGLRPNSIDGLDWLAASGYRTVLDLREPGQVDTGDRKQFESRGIKYITLEVSPENLTSDTLDRFNRAVTDLAAQPLFVYDKDGMLTGGLWYLHFRLVDQLPDDDALKQAARLGLKTDPQGGHQRMLLGVQKYLSQRNP